MFREHCYGSLNVIIHTFFPCTLLVTPGPVVHVNGTSTQPCSGTFGTVQAFVHMIMLRAISHTQIRVRGPEQITLSLKPSLGCVGTGICKTCNLTPSEMETQEPIETRTTRHPDVRSVLLRTGQRSQTCFQLRGIAGQVNEAHRLFRSMPSKLKNIQ